MKSIVQRIQSRMSARRKVIAGFEDTYQRNKEDGNFGNCRSLRELLNQWGEEQRLDRDLLKYLQMTDELIESQEDYISLLLGEIEGTNEEVDSQ